MKGHLSFHIAALFSVVSSLLTFIHWGSRYGKEGSRSWKLVGKWEEKQLACGYRVTTLSSRLGDWIWSETCRSAEWECKK